MSTLKLTSFVNAHISIIITISGLKYFLSFLHKLQKLKYYSVVVFVFFLNVIHNITDIIMSNDFQTSVYFLLTNINSVDALRKSLNNKTTS